MKRKEIVAEAKKNVEEQDLKEQIKKVEKLIRNINEAKERFEEVEKSLKDYLEGKPLLKIKEDNKGTITLDSPYSISNGISFST